VKRIVWQESDRMGLLKVLQDILKELKLIRKDLKK